MSRRVGIAAVGAVACCGADVDTVWRALHDGRSGIAPLRRLDTTGFPVIVAVEVPWAFESYCPPSPWTREVAADPRRINCRLFVGALAQALGRCTPDPRVPAERRGFYAAIRPEEHEDVLLERDPVGAPPSWSPLRVAADLELRGPQLMLHDACTTGTALLGEAFHDLRDGLADLAVVAAANADLTLETLCHYTLLSALSAGTGPDACRPFDARRDGFVRAEGAGAIVLVAWDDGASPPDGVLAEITGYGASADAWRPTAGHPEQRGVVLALRRCLADARLSADDVAHVNAHGTGTPMNDLHEARALHEVLGERAARVPLTACKAVTGHASFASGLIEAIAAASTLRTGLVPPTAHYEQPDAGLPPLDVVAGGPRETRPASAISLSSAFGGLNAALLLRRV